MKIIYWVSLLGAILLVVNTVFLIVSVLPHVSWWKYEQDFPCGVNGAPVTAQLALSLWTRNRCNLAWVNGTSNVCESHCTFDKWNVFDCSQSRAEGDTVEMYGETKLAAALMVTNSTEVASSGGSDDGDGDAPYCYKFDKAARTAAGIIISGMVLASGGFVLAILGFLFLERVLPSEEEPVELGAVIETVSSSSDLAAMEEAAEDRRPSMEITRVMEADEYDDVDALSPPSAFLNGLYDIATAFTVVIEWSPVTQMVFCLIAFCLYLSSVIAYPLLGDKSGWEADHEHAFDEFAMGTDIGAPKLHLSDGWYLLLVAVVLQGIVIGLFSLFIHWFFHYSSKRFLGRNDDDELLAVMVPAEAP